MKDAKYYIIFNPFRKYINAMLGEVENALRSKPYINPLQRACLVWLRRSSK